MPKLPNPAAAVISDRKLSGYLLSPTHSEGAPKARFFASFGFSGDEPEILRRALLRHSRQGEVTATITSEFGVIYEVNGRIESPDGRNPWLLVVWMIDEGTDWPRLITAIPSEDRS